jgi:peptidoglycan/xylan/chitin deacetylase (PgdA/CDA1 family)
MKKIYTAILLLLIVRWVQAAPADSSARWPEEIQVATWYNFSKAAYSLTFDDGLISQYQYLAPLLDKYNLKATFFLITGSLEEDPTRRPEWRYGYWHQFVELAGKGHELGAHTVTHPRLSKVKDGGEREKNTLQYELAEPIKNIREKIPGYQVVSFAYPYVDYNRHVKEEAMKYYVATRAAGAAVNMPGDIRWGDLQADIIEYHGPRTEESDHKKITDLQTELEAKVIGSGGWGVLLAHDVLPLAEAREAGDSWHPISEESFRTFAAWLHQKQEARELWVATMGNVARYAKQRENLQIHIREKTTQKIVYQLDDQLPDDVYNQPLSLEITLPADWKKVRIVQGRKKETKVVAGGKITYHALPGKDLLQLFRVE